VAWFFSDTGEAPAKVQEIVRQVIRAPDAQAPARKGMVSALTIMFAAFAKTAEEKVLKLLAGHEQRLNVVDARTHKVDDLERRFNALIPRSLDSKYGKTCVTSQYSDGSYMINTVERLPPDGQTLEARKTRVDGLEATIQEMESALTRAQVLSYEPANRRAGM